MWKNSLLSSHLLAPLFSSLLILPSSSLQCLQKTEISFLVWLLWFPISH